MYYIPSQLRWRGNNYNEIEIDLFIIIVFPSPTQKFPENVNKMSISMDLYPLILESTDLQQAMEINSTRNVKVSDVNFPLRDIQ
jgi:hypothetical protein